MWYSGTSEADILAHEVSDEDRAAVAMVAEAERIHDFQARAFAEHAEARARLLAQVEAERPAFEAMAEAQRVARLAATRQWWATDASD